MTGNSDGPRILAPQPPAAHDYSNVAPSGKGCPRCDDFPDYPAQHCGRPLCRDDMIVAYARQTGIDPAFALDDATRQAQAADTAAAEDPGPASAETSAGLCGGCVLVDACVVGSAIVRTSQSLRALVTPCEGFKPAPQAPSSPATGSGPLEPR